MVYIKRELESEFMNYFSEKEILAIVGTRQCGKTTLVNELLDNLETKGKKINRVSFDNVKILELFEKDIDSFVELYVKDVDILFIDEVHYAKAGGKILKYLYDGFNIKIIISGSSAAEMSIQSLKYLVGRILIFRLYPFSFGEFLRAKDEGLANIYEKGKFGKEIIDKLNSFLDEYLIYGGYPRVVLTIDKIKKKKMLGGIFSTYLLKEIKEILGLSENSQLIDLLKLLSLQIGNIINYDELSSISGFSYFELKKYFDILEKTFICKRVKPYFRNKRTELVKSPKIYFFDNGFRNICIDNFNLSGADKGFLYENFVFSEIVKNKDDLKFWRTKSGAEVDFVVETGKNVLPIEIKSILRQDKVSKSFRSFINNYSPVKGYVFSLNYENTRKINNSEIFFKPFVKFTPNDLKL